jgi:hypothetical protein
MIMAVAFALPPAGAGAAQQLGMTSHPSNAPAALNCLKETAPMNNTATLIQYQRQTGSTPTYIVPPGGGVITSWAHTAPLINWAEKAALQVFRPAGGTNFQVIGQSALETINGNLVGPEYNSFLTRIPVQAGDVIGVSVEHIGNVAYCQEAPDPLYNPDDKTREIPGTGNSGAELPSPTLGSTLNFNTTDPNNEQSARLSLAATVERDADGDGFGDVTQDFCPADPSGPCVPAPPGGGAPTPPAAGPTGQRAAALKKCKKKKGAARKKCKKKAKKLPV